jgi:hypothetical protein
MKSDLERLVALADLQLKIEADVARLETELKERNASLRKVSEEDMPDLMIELGVTQFKLASGKVVKLREDIRLEDVASRKEKLPAAIGWLTAHGFDGIVKSAVIALFGKGEKEEAEIVLEQLRTKGYAVSFDEGINPQTLKSFIKERIAKEEDVPLDLFGAYPFHKSVITEK